MLVIFKTLKDETCSQDLNAQTSALGYSFGIQSVVSVVKHWTCSDNALPGGWLNILFSLTSGLCSWLKLFSSPSSCGAQLCFSGNIFSSKLGVFLPCSSKRFWNFSSVLYNKVAKHHKKVWCPGTSTKMLFLLLPWRAGWELMVKEGKAQDPSLNPAIHRAGGG